MEFFAISNGLPVHILDTKKGDRTILLLHGYLETLYIYEEFINLLKKDYRVIAVDLPGHGLSGSNKEINTMEFSAAVVRDILNVCKVSGPVYIAGHSMGGYIALTCMKLFPEVFSGLILLNSTPFPDLPSKVEDREREIELINNAKINTIATIGIPKTYAPQNLRRLDDKIEETIENTEAHDPAGIVACLKGMMQRGDSSELLKTIPKLLMIFGDKDILPAEVIAQIIALAPQGTSVIIPETGHNSFIEAPDKTLELIKEFTK